MTRLDIDKTVLDSVLQAIPQPMQDSGYGRCIRLHIDTHPLTKGDEIYEFEAIDADSVNLGWKVLKGKQLLILHGGLEYMEKRARQDLYDLYNSTSRDDFEIIVFWKTENVDELKRIREVF